MSKQLTQKEKAILAMQGNNLSAYTINNLSAYTINNLSAYTINNLSAYTIKKYNNFWDSIPKIENSYTRLFDDINEKKRIHKQSTFGPSHVVEDENLCGTPGCTAFHLVQMAGKRGYELQKEFGWAAAATFIHRKTHPDYPLQNYGDIPQDWALAYVEEMANREKEENK